MGATSPTLPSDPGAALATASRSAVTPEAESVAARGAIGHNYRERALHRSLTRQARRVIIRLIELLVALPCP